RVKIADFGLAKLLGAPSQEALTSAGQVMGTPHYMAPEQLEHPRDVDHRADLFSLGVVFYEMLTGELPLGRFAAPSKRVEVDVRLDEIVLRSLEHERERRYQHAVQVKTDVQRVESSPASERPKPAPEPEVEAALGLVVDEKGWRMMPSGKAPTPGWWFIILFAAWLVCGTSFNLGALGFGAVSIPLLAWLFLSLVRYRPGWTEPKDARELTKRRFEAVTCLLFGFLGLFGTFMAGCERFTFHYVAPASSADAGLDALRGCELEALRSLDPDLDLASLELELQLQRSSVQDSPDVLLRRPGLLAVATLALLAAAAWYWARPERKHTAPLLASSLFLFLGPLPCVLFLNLAVQGFRTSGASVYAGREVLADELEPVAGRLYAACLEEDWRVTAQHDARIVDRLTGIELAEVRTLIAAPPSPFDRWRMTWRGPIRQEPQVVFTLLSRPASDGSPRTRVQALGGLAELESAADWSRELAALLRRL
ncbi:MAG: protein kinase, partial [Planctomycetota bacterium]